MTNPTVWIKTYGWSAVRADRLHAICVTTDPSKFTTNPRDDPDWPVWVAVSTGLPDGEGGEQVERLGICKSAFADESVHELMTVLAKAAWWDAGFVVVAGKSPGELPDSRGMGGLLPQPIEWKLHPDEWPVPKRPVRPPRR